MAPSAKNIGRVALKTGREAAQWAFTQWAMRDRARTKFSRASEMLFDRVALEQASHESVARYHASQFPVGEPVLDVTTGIGSDLIALLGRGPANGFELDPTIAFYASYNCGITVCNSDCLGEVWNADYIFADPSRRDTAGKRVSASKYSPDLQVLSSRMLGHKKCCIKLSPLMRNDELSSLGRQIQFLSHENECKEANVWIGKDLEEGIVAVHLESGSFLKPVTGREISGNVGEYLYDSNPAAIRAGCLGTLCRDFELSEVGDSNGYLTGNQLHTSPWLRAFRVIEHGSFHEKTIKSIGPLSAIKTRKVEFRPEVLMKRATISNDGNVLFLFKIHKSIKYVLAQRP